MSDANKGTVKNTSEENLVMLHLSLAKNVREQFGLWDDYTALLKSCGTSNPDDASMAIVRSIWNHLQKEQ